MSRPQLFAAHAAAIADVLTHHAGTAGALLPVLHDVQARLGHVPPAAVAVIAEALHLSRAEVHGVLSYYHDFRDSPPPAHRLRICQAEACQACGSDVLLAHCEALLGCPIGHTSADGLWSLEPVYCLGLCAQSPAVELDGQLHAWVTPQHAQQLIDSTPRSQGGT